jgi:hypothetical protein
MPEQIAPQVTAFITAHVKSAEALQVLMLLVQSPDRWWDAAAVRRETGLAASIAGRALQQLASSNLLDIKVTGDVRYRFAPGTPDLQVAAGACCDLYYRTPWLLVSALPGVTRRSLSDFADAFRIRRDDDR